MDNMQSIKIQHQGKVDLKQVHNFRVDGLGGIKEPFVFSK